MLSTKNSLHIYKNIDILKVKKWKKIYYANINPKVKPPKNSTDV